MLKPALYRLSVLLIFSYLILNPKSALAAENCPSNHTSTGIGCVPNDPAGLVNKILEIGLGVAGGVAFLMLVYGGFRLVFSQGNPDAIQGAREVITSAIVGLLIVIFSVFFLNLIGVNILRLPI